MFWLRSFQVFEQIFALFLGTFIVNFEYYLYIVNATLCQNFVENQKGVIFMGVVAKHLFPTIPMISPMGCSPKIFVYKLL